MSDYKIGIMQGRLSPPTDGKFQSFPKYSWKDEFYTASEIGLNSIEWIFEADNWEKNPLSNSEGIKEIIEIMKETNISIEAVCSDYFMDIPYLSADLSTRRELSETLIWLIYNVSEIGGKFIDIPFVDSSKIDSRDQFVLIKEFLTPACKPAEKYNIILTLETSLSPSDFTELLLFLNNPNIAANYDTGNSSGIGYNCVEELRTYGRYIRTIHIKDRLLNNGSKPLGTGSADFDSFFSELAKLNFQGPLVLQAAREEVGKEYETALKNKLFVEKYLRKYNL